MAQYFSLTEAQRLIPQVESSLRDALAIKSDLDDSSRELEGVARQISYSGGALIDRGAVMAQKNRQHALASRLRETLAEIHGYGCLVKDLDIGLIDFPTRYQGREVYLCWRLGEQGIRYWHGTDEGFSGRKPIDEEFRAGHSGSTPS